MSEMDTLRVMSDGDDETAAPSKRFRILRPHAEGGLGQVFLADDLELCREVALKEIQPRHAFEPATRARFIKEARVTGGLEHPGIVPVYALGSHADGRPFYAMRFIQGDSFQQAIDNFHRGVQRPRQPAMPAPSTSDGENTVEQSVATSPPTAPPDTALPTAAKHPTASHEHVAIAPPDYTSLTFRDLLRRFIGACHAIAYAHSRGVLHRDIKPNNIMLGPYGETLVVDWGLAKSIHEPTENPVGLLPSASSSGENSLQTAPGSTVGTPAYMSPEQAEARLEDMGPPSDIYALGATLYRLLTGRNAFQNRDLAILFAQIERGDFPPPRRVAPRVPLGLEAICLKAMALLPHQRYATASKLADDVERWLADEPVDARIEPWSTRAGRWMRKHQTVVVGVGAAVVVATFSLGLGMTRLAEANGRLRLANEAVTTARDAEATQRQLAERRFEQARAAVDEYLAQVNRDIRLQQKEPIALELRKSLLEKARPFYEDFLEQARDDASLQRRVATAAACLAGIERELSPGPKSKALLERALAIQKDLLARLPGDRELQKELARTLHSMAELAASLGETDKALEYHREALALRRALVKGDPANFDFRLDLASSLFGAANMTANLGNLQSAIDQLDETARVQEQLAAERPDHPTASFDLARTFGNQGVAHSRLGKPGEALKMFQKALAIQQRLAAAHPNLVGFTEEVGRTTNNLANVYGMTGNPAKAAEQLIAAHDIFDRLARDYPRVPRFRSLAASAANNAGYISAVLGKSDQAALWYGKARAIREDLVRDYPAIDDYAAELASTLVNVGNLGRETGAVARSLEPLGKAIELLDRLLIKQSQNPTLQQFARNAHWGRAESLTKLKRHAEALADWDMALRMESGADRVPLRIQRAATLARLGRHAEASSEATQLATGENSGERLFSLACTLATSAEAAASDKSLGATERVAQSKQCVDRAIDLLRAAQRVGYFATPRAAGQLQDDEDLKSVRGNSAFQKLLDEVLRRP